MMLIEFLHPKCTADHLGELPYFLHEKDKRKARDQFNENYPFGGWRPIEGFRMKGTALLFPGDPPLNAIARTQLHDELILFYEHAIVAIVQMDGTFEAARMD